MPVWKKTFKTEFAPLLVMNIIQNIKQTNAIDFDGRWFKYIKNRF